MPDQCDRRDSAWIEKLMAAHDLRYRAIFDGMQEALRLAREENMHWKKEADDWRKRADERERDFTPKVLFYVMWIGGFGVSTTALLVAIYVALK